MGAPEIQVAAHYSKEFGKPVSSVLITFGATHVAFEDGEEMTFPNRPSNT